MRCQRVKSELGGELAFRDVIENIRPAVFGMGCLLDQRDPLSVVILGTGFMVHEDGWIMTNRHVAEMFMGERDGQVGVRNALARAVLFIDAAGRAIPGQGVAVAGCGAVPCPIIEVAMPPGPPDGAPHYESAPDLAVCRIDLEGLGRMGVRRPRSLTMGNSQEIRAGDEIGILGFPLGLTIKDQEETLHQMTAIAQRGVIAAVLPYGGIPNPHAFQLDMNINGGSSGSPLFKAETGEVVGVVFAARVRPHEVEIQTPQGVEHVATVPLPTGLGYAVPINRYHEQPRRSRHLPPVVHE
jgi:S1-C subfamily serine protease